MDLSRGDVVVAVAPGEYGKPRPAVIVQSDLFNPTHASLVVCPVTTHLLEAPLFRLALPASSENGLRQPSQIMVDKMQALKRERISRTIGRLNLSQIRALDEAVRLWLAV